MQPRQAWANETRQYQMDEKVAQNHFVLLIQSSHIRGQGERINKIGFIFFVFANLILIEGDRQHANEIGNMMI